MNFIKTEIVIKAPKEKVWSTLMDHSKYGEWNPFIKEVSGSSKVGDQLHVLIQSNPEKTMVFEPYVLVNKENVEFRWEGRLFVKGLFDGQHYFILEETAEGDTRFIHGENFSGLLSGALLGLIREDTQKGFQAMNQALKKRAEENWNAQL